MTILVFPGVVVFVMRIFPGFVTVLLLLQAVCVVPIGTVGYAAPSAGRASIAPKLADSESMSHMSAWANDTSAYDSGHVFYIKDNELMWWDTAKNTTSLLMTVTYNITGCPLCPPEPSVLTKVGASRLENGSYHVALLEMEPKNNATAQYLMGVVLTTNGSVIYHQRAKDLNVTKFVIERIIIGFVRVYPDGVNKSLEFMVWQGAGYYVSDHQMGQGGSLEIALAIAYTSMLRYVVTYATDTCHGVNTLITDNGQGWGGFGCYIKEVGTDWTIERMDSYGGCDETTCFTVNAMIERNLVNGSRKVDYWMMKDWDKKADVVVFQDNDEYQVLPDSPLEVIWDGCFVDLAFRVNHEAGVAPHPPPEVWIKRIGLFGELLKDYSSSTITRGSISLIDADGGIFMTGYSPGYAFMPAMVKFDYRTKVFGDWGVDDLGVFPLNGSKMEGEVFNVSFRPFMAMDICPMDCMNASTAVLLVDNVPIPGQRIPLQTVNGSAWFNLTWTAVAGFHSIKVRMEVADDIDLLDNEISLGVQIDEYPDIVVRDLTVGPSVVYPDQEVNFQVRVLNSGGNLTKATLCVYLDGAMAWNITISNLISGYTNMFTGHFTITNETVGPHSIKAEALPLVGIDRDLKNNAVFGNVRVYYRDLALEITTPRDRQEVTRSLLVEGTVVDPEGFNTTVRAELWRNVLVSSSEMDGKKGTFSFTFDISDLQPSQYTIVVTANGTEQRTATQRLDVIVQNEPYWSVLDPADGTLIVIDEGSSTNITAIAKDGATGNEIPVTWTINGWAAKNFTGVSIVGHRMTFGTGYHSAGTYMVEAKTSSRFGNLSAMWRIVVLDVNRPPTITDMNPAPGHLKVQVNKTLNLTTMATDLDGDTLSYVWTFDNETVYGRNITLRPGRAGNFTLGLKVSDGIDEASASWTVEVTKPPPVVVPKTKIKNDSAVANMALALVIALMAVTVVSALILRNALKPKNKEEPGHKK